MTKAPGIGDCKLCGASQVELQDSHIQPRWAYRHLRDRNATKNVDPVYVGKGSRALQVSHQVSEHLLCVDCENRFSVLENHVKGLAYQYGGTSMPILGLLGPRDGCEENVEGYALGSVDGRKLYDFALSVVWRAHVCTLEDTDRCDLGPMADRFRDCLRGVTSDCRHTTVTCYALGIADPKWKDVAANFSMPQSDLMPSDDDPSANWWMHRFVLCGLRFVVSVGIAQPAAAKYICVGTGTEPMVLVVQRAAFLETIADVFRGAVPVGALRKQMDARAAARAPAKT